MGKEKETSGCQSRTEPGCLSEKVEAGKTGRNES